MIRKKIILTIACLLLIISCTMAGCKKKEKKKELQEYSVSTATATDVPTTEITTETTTEVITEEIATFTDADGTVYMSEEEYAKTLETVTETLVVACEDLPLEQYETIKNETIPIINDIVKTTYTYHKTEDISAALASYMGEYGRYQTWNYEFPNKLKKTYDYYNVEIDCEDIFIAALMISYYKNGDIVMVFRGYAKTPMKSNQIEYNTYGNCFNGKLVYVEGAWHLAEMIPQRVVEYPCELKVIDAYKNKFYCPSELVSFWEVDTIDEVIEMDNLEIPDDIENWEGADVEYID